MTNTSMDGKAVSGAIDATAAMREFITNIAKLTKDGEEVNSSGKTDLFDMESDVAVETLNNAISKARSLLQSEDSGVSTTSTKSVSRVVYLNCFTTDGDGHSPTCGQVDVTPELLAKIEKLSVLCQIHDLSEVREYESSCQWLPASFAEEMFLSNDELVVTSSGFWWRSIMKHWSIRVDAL